MVITRSSTRVVQAVTFFIVMYVAVQLAIYWGVDEKTWWQRSWEFLAGGSVGAIIGVVFFFVFGAIGWVSGPVFGALGLFGLMMGGALGGLGLGALLHIARSPSDFSYNAPVIVLVLLLGVAVALGLATLLGRATRGALQQEQVPR